MDIIKEGTVSLEKLLNLGTLRVPRFQRDYSWSKAEWMELWEDIEETICDADQPESHYMGYIFLQKGETSKEFGIIDGQQRITTLYMLLLAIVKLIGRAEPGSNAANDLYRNFLGSRRASTNESISNLILNNYNDPVLSELLKEDTETNRRRVVGSNRLLYGVFDFFKKMVAEKTGKDTVALSKLAENIAENLYFTYITASSGINTYKIYQTLNARGLELSINDLLKNHLFTVIDQERQLSEQELDKLQSDWRDIEDAVGASNLAKFISLEWNRREEFSRKKELFQKISASLNDSPKVRAYLDNIGRGSELYAHLVNKYETAFWSKNYPGVASEMKKCLECLNSLNIKSPHGMILSAVQKMAGNPKRLKTLLRIITAISVRYNCICQEQANIQEQSYSKIANMIFSENFAFNDKTIRMLREMYPSNEKFQKEFAAMEFNSNVKPKYLLMTIENHLNKNDSLDRGKMTLEHILPKKPSAQWMEAFPEKIHENYIHRLGNMTLLPERPNKELRNKPFKDKRKEFKSSPVLLTKEHVSKHSVWNPKSIDKHQQFLAKAALKIWFIDWNKIK